MHVVFVVFVDLIEVFTFDSVIQGAHYFINVIIAILLTHNPNVYTYIDECVYAC